ncbi:hypothetical protein RRF57_010723 [Xylaria bambusicola]|uniref:Uncharacterized protein n=1 Tax=Xylaria bambusicola TaxID=326684 RepID=A0AAN7UXJ1_9PEZI
MDIDASEAIMGEAFQITLHSSEDFPRILPRKSCGGLRSAIGIIGEKSTLFSYVEHNTMLLAVTLQVS